MEQQQDKSGTSTQSVLMLFALIGGALVAVSIYNFIDGRTIVGFAGLAVTAALIPIALRARADAR